MALAFGNLSTYTDQITGELMRKAILKGRFTSLVRVEPGIKSAKNLNILDSTLYAVAGGCGFVTSGSTNLSAVTLTVCDLKVNESICPRSLEAYWTQTLMKPGQYPVEIPFEQFYAEEKAAKLSALIEDVAIRGNTSTGSGNMSLCSGILQQVDITSVSASTINMFNQAGGVTTAWTVGNSVAMIDAAISLLPTDIQDQDDLTLFVSFATYRTILTAYRNAGYSVTTVADGQIPGASLDNGVLHPGSINVKVVPLRGLSASATAARFFLTPASNIAFGCDLLSDAEKFRIWYSQDNDEVRFLSAWSQGVVVIFPEFLVRG